MLLTSRLANATLPANPALPANEFDSFLVCVVVPFCLPVRTPKLVARSVTFDVSWAALNVAYAATRKMTALRLPPRTVVSTSHAVFRIPTAVLSASVTPLTTSMIAFWFSVFESQSVIFVIVSVICGVERFGDRAAHVQQRFLEDVQLAGRACSRPPPHSRRIPC